MKRISSVFFSFLLVFSAPVQAEDLSLQNKMTALRASSANPELVQLATLLEQSVAAYETIHDYRAVFHKQEKSGSELGARETIFLKFEKPFKIFMHWLDTHKQGLQVLYERGRHDGKLAIHKPGLMLGLVPVVFLEQSSPWVREGSESYDIEDAGIGTFLNDFSEMVLQGAADGKISVRISGTEGGTDVDASFPGAEESDRYFASRAEVFFDEKTRLPLRMSLYGWDGRLTGIYEYGELVLNVGADDSEFKRLAQRKLYKLYLGPIKVTKTTNFTSR